MSIKIITNYTYKNGQHVRGYWSYSYHQYTTDMSLRKKMRQGSGVELGGY